MSEEHGYCRRLIEVDLPIKVISAYARAEKNMRSGHVWHLHIWWARRPWGACRAVELAALLPDPMDPKCPEEFVDTASNIMRSLRYSIQKEERNRDLQKALLHFIGEYAEWQKGTVSFYRSAAQSLMKAAHPESQPVLIDSFSGNGAIPGEALRLGCDSIAVDINPVATLILKAILEYIPKHGEKLLDIYRKGSRHIKDEAKLRMAEYYPLVHGKEPIAWLWARTVTCEGPGCGATIPLISQTTIGKGKQKTWIEIIANKSTKQISVKLRCGKTVPSNLVKTAGGGAAVCPVCGFTNPKASVKKQGKERRMGQYLYGVVVPIGERQGKEYCEPTNADLLAFKAAIHKLNYLVKETKIDPIEEPFPLTYGLHVPPHYGISKWGDIFSERQKLYLHTMSDIIHQYYDRLITGGTEKSLAKAVTTLLSLAISNSVHYSTNMSTWLEEHMISAFIVGNAIAMRWDWAEGNPLVHEYVGGMDYAFTQAEGAIITALNIGHDVANVFQGDAQKLPFPDDSVDMFFTDPPYYDVVPYADLSDLCYIWLKRFVGRYHSDLFSEKLTPKKDQIVVNPYTPDDGRGIQNQENYQERMTGAFREGRRVLKPNGIATIVFAHKGTAAWESLLAAVIDSGFIITASWPIDTERGSRMRANNSAALASSIHLVCRPRENMDGSLRTNFIGDWRDVLRELPLRIHEWMPRLAKEGIVGADAIFACLGPALEVFSRYSSVEKPNGDKVSLKEYMEHVWAAISKEALSVVFNNVDSAGFEEDSRLTAIWLWTLSTTQGMNDTTVIGSGEDEKSGSKTKSTGYSLEYDTARKIAQGLGAHMDKLISIIEIKGDSARLLSVEERARYLFGKMEEPVAIKKKDKAKQAQLNLFDLTGDLENEAHGEVGRRSTGTPVAGATILDRVHQCMLLFAAGRADAMKRFLVEDGIGHDQRFWKLAQALSALYPGSSDEKRWVDGVLARKKGLGL